MKRFLQNPIWELISFEYKKILKLRAFIILYCFAALFSLFSPMISSLVSSNFHRSVGYAAFQSNSLDKKVVQLNKGYVTEEILLEIAEMEQNRYRLQSDYSFSSMPEYHDNGQYGIDYQLPYYPVYSFLLDVVSLRPLDYVHKKTILFNLSFSLGSYEPDSLFTEDGMTDFYEKYRAALLDKINETSNLTDAERESLSKMSQSIKVPFYSEYNKTYTSYPDMLSAIGLFTLFLISLMASGIFGNEYAGRTAALLLSSRYGKSKNILAKILTGISGAVLINLSLSLLHLLGYMLIHGASGAGTPFQFIRDYAYSPYPITAGQSILIFLTASVFVCAAYSAFVMLLSACIKKPSITVSLSTLMIFLPVFFSDYSSRLALQLTYLIPWQVFDYHAVFCNYQYVFGSVVIPPALFYVIFSAFLMIILLPMAGIKFRRYQVS